MGMDAARAIRTAREAAGLSKRELARRAHTSPAAIVAYESGAREPTLPTLARVLGGAGARVDLDVTSTRDVSDPATLAERLAQVLDLAEHLPRRPAARRLAYPPLR
jgi:transcriptional regulator with XRE-family HTH domain